MILDIKIDTRGMTANLDMVEAMCQKAWDLLMLSQELHTVMSETWKEEREKAQS